MFHGSDYNWFVKEVKQLRKLLAKLDFKLIGNGIKFPNTTEFQK